MTYLFQMPIFRCVATFAFLTTASIAQSQEGDCKTDDYLEAAIAHLESHYRSFPEELFTVQLYLKEGFDQTAMKLDGKWGPKTEKAVCGALLTYTEIGGSEDDWGIQRANHTPTFTRWLLRAARANLSDGEIEFPD